MPIEAPILPRLSTDEMRELDYIVMGHAFASHHELGRLCDEPVYQADLAARLRSAGISARREERICVRHRDFVKPYDIDLIVADKCIYELKAVASLIGEHESQLLNYLLLTNAAHGKLVNFRPGKVESRFVNAPVDDVRRRQFRIVRDSLEASASSLRDLVLELITDWGMFLDLSLYTQALVHFLGGDERVLQMVPMMRGTEPLGNQRVQLYSPDVAFRVTGFKHDLASQQAHLRQMLKLTPLRAIHWINLCRDEISLVTVR